MSEKERWEIFVRAEEGGAFDELYAEFAAQVLRTDDARPAGEARYAVKERYVRGVYDLACDVAGGPILPRGDRDAVAQFFGEHSRLPGGPRLPPAKNLHGKIVVK